MISDLHVWSLGKNKGASSFYRTIEGYTSRGFQIDLIIANRYEGVEDLTNLQVFHFDLPFVKRLAHIPKIGFFFFGLWWLIFQCAAVTWGFILSRRNRPDIVCGYEIVGVPAAALLGRALHRPSVARFQGTVMRPLMKRRFWKLRFWKHYIALKWPVDLVIMANDGTEGDKVLQALGVDEKRVRFWMNGVDRSFLESVPDSLIARTREELGLDAGCSVLLTLSRLTNWKRVERIINAMPCIVERNPNVHCVIVGDGDARDDYERLVEHLGMQNFVTFVGAVPHGDTKRYLALADVFVSLYDLSNLGNPLLEAMMMGKCIVTLNNGATGTVIKNNVNGILLELDELDRLPDVIAWLLGNKEFRQKLGSKARSYAEGNFWDWNERMDEEIKQVQLMLNDKIVAGETQIPGTRT